MFLTSLNYISMLIIVVLQDVNEKRLLNLKPFTLINTRKGCQYMINYVS